MQGHQQLHSVSGRFGVFQKIGSVGQAEQLCQVQDGPRGLLTTHHAEMLLVSIEPGHEDDARFVITGRRRKDMAR